MTAPSTSAIAYRQMTHSEYQREKIIGIGSASTPTQRLAAFFENVVSRRRFGLRQKSVTFPDVTNVQVQIATEATGRSPEEVERFATVPLEVAMTGLPGLEEMRSLNKPGLSLITLVFTDATDVYFARQLVMERLIEVAGRMPQGVTPTLGPLSTGLGEVYQYTLERGDDGDKVLSVEELTRRRIARLEFESMLSPKAQLVFGRYRLLSQKVTAAPAPLAM